MKKEIEAGMRREAKARATRVRSLSEAKERTINVPALIPTKLPRRYGCGVCGSAWIDFFPGQVCPKCNGLNTIRRLKAGEILKPERGGIS